jgi:hypothetical protein
MLLKYRRARKLAFLAAAGLALWPSLASAEDIAWEFWVPVPGAVDIDGPRTDGKFIVAGAAALWLLDPSGEKTEFARGPGGYHEDAGAETYIAMSRAMHLDSAGCDWTADETYILRMHGPFGVNRVSADGSESGSFANTPGVRILTGINFDTEGTFGNRLLVLGIRPNNRSVVFAVDCNGKTAVIAEGLPSLEGQIAVAPEGFGSFAGDLIIPDETGRILAVTPDGKLKVLLARPPAGVDKTIGALGFVPGGFTDRGGDMYHADHKTPGSTIPGTDSILRMKGDQLFNAGVRDGDLLATAEVGGALIDVRCAETCTATRLSVADKAHTEGHFPFALNAPLAPSPTPAAAKAGGPILPQGVLDLVGMWGLPAGVFLLLVAFLAVVAVQAVRRRTK